MKASISHSDPPVSRVPVYVLPLIVLSQFCGTSLWFASNGVMEDLTQAFHLPGAALSHLTVAVQFGFISGTLFFAVLTVADRFSPSRVFFAFGLFGALANLGLVWEGNSFTTLLLTRFITGFFLAGIYPVGMKIASDYYNRGLGTSLGYLVGALVVGTAFPHLLNAEGLGISWKMVLCGTSFLAVSGGVLMWLLPDGPYQKRMQRLDFTAFFKVFRDRDFRAAAFGYFGHMWELYAFWAFVPLILAAYINRHPGITLSVSLWCFIIIGIGGVACVAGGYLSRIFGEKKIAAVSLLLSGGCCLLLPWAITWGQHALFLGYLMVWGMTVIADSPLFSTLVARNAGKDRKGTALTIVTSIGFAITILSIEALGALNKLGPHPANYLILSLGPILGLLALKKGRNGEVTRHP